MTLCKVMGSVTASDKHPAFNARKLLIVQPVDDQKKEMGRSFLAVDNISGAGKGDLVLVLREGNGVRQLLGEKLLPIRSLIVGVVDEVST